MPFKPGVDPNRKVTGRPKKGTTLTDILTEMLNEHETIVGDKGIPVMVQKKVLFLNKIYSMAMAGDITAAKYLYDRIDGKLTEKRELTGEDGAPLFPNIRVTLEAVSGDDGKESES